MIIRENVPLAPLTTFRIGGPARFFIEAHTIEEVTQALAFAHERTLPLFVLGGGSNILIADEGFSGLVLCVRISHIVYEERNGQTYITVGAGVVWDELVIWTVEHALVGLECLSGVPGTVGGAVAVNLGGYGAQVSDTLVNVEVVDRKDEEQKTLATKECSFSYHDSIFAREPERYIITRATFALSSGDPSPLTYRDSRFDLTALAARLHRPPKLSDIRNAILDVREQKGNLIMKGRLSYQGAGSFFHLPFVSAEKYEEILARARARDAVKEESLRPWSWQQPDGSYKIASGFLLEYTEFTKGYVRGAVGISPKHTLAIINLGGARAEEVITLARDMQDAVETQFGIRLEREVEYVGEGAYTKK